MTHAVIWTRHVPCIFSQESHKKPYLQFESHKKPYLYNSSLTKSPIYNSHMGCHSYESHSHMNPTCALHLFSAAHVRIIDRAFLGVDRPLLCVYRALLRVCRALLSFIYTWCARHRSQRPMRHMYERHYVYERHDLFIHTNNLRCKWHRRFNLSPMKSDVIWHMSLIWVVWVWGLSYASCGCGGSHMSWLESNEVRCYMTCGSHMSRVSHMHDASIHQKCEYGVATISGIIQIICLFCRI